MSKHKIHYHPNNNIYMPTYCGLGWNSYNEDTGIVDNVTCSKCLAKLNKKEDKKELVRINHLIIEVSHYVHNDNMLNCI